MANKEILLGIHGTSKEFTIARMDETEDTEDSIYIFIIPIGEKSSKILEDQQTSISAFHGSID